MAEPLRVVIADDQYLVREGTRRLLEDTGQVEVVAAVGSATELLDAVPRLRPDAVIADIRMPPGHRMEGIETGGRGCRPRPGRPPPSWARPARAPRLQRLISQFADISHTGADLGANAEPEEVLQFAGRASQWPRCAQKGERTARPLGLQHADQFVTSPSSVRQPWWWMEYLPWCVGTRAARGPWDGPAPR